MPTPEQIAKDLAALIAEARRVAAVCQAPWYKHGSDILLHLAGALEGAVGELERLKETVGKPTGPAQKCPRCSCDTVVAVYAKYCPRCNWEEHTDA